MTWYKIELGKYYLLDIEWNCFVNFPSSTIQFSLLAILSWLPMKYNVRKTLEALLSCVYKAFTYRSPCVQHSLCAPLGLCVRSSLTVQKRSPNSVQRALTIQPGKKNASWTNGVELPRYMILSKRLALCWKTHVFDVHAE